MESSKLLTLVYKTKLLKQPTINLNTFINKAQNKKLYERYTPNSKNKDILDYYAKHSLLFNRYSR